eukprot:TRINITY_DN5420_c0_g1_i1.p1 TRINITY_DN5420_c0_g1~~TRINITY_DN5420_c0_g1_i1.p1  ORF type:complete len:590 (-),score=86.03 TRINITY_DN5420_c0_g1_i1:91-1860(-)
MSWVVSFLVGGACLASLPSAFVFWGVVFPVVMLFLIRLTMIRTFTRSVKVMEEDAPERKTSIWSKDLAPLPSVLPYTEPLADIWYIVRNLWKGKFGFVGVTVSRNNKLFRSGFDMGTKMFQSNFVGKKITTCADPEAIRDVFVKQSSKFVRIGSDSVHLQEFLGSGLLFSEGEQWKRHRKLIGPAFRFDYISGLCSAMTRVSNTLIRRLDGAVSNGNGSHCMQVVDEMTRFTLDVISNCGFGYDMQAINSSEKTRVERDAYEVLLGAIASPLRQMFPLYNKLPTAANAKIHKSNKIFMQLIDKMITKKRVTLDKLMADIKSAADDVGDGGASGTENGTAKSGGGKIIGGDALVKSGKEFDMLDLLIMAESSEDGKNVVLSNTELIHNVNTFFLAGHETTASLMSILFWLLTEHQDVQQRLRAEAVEVLGKEEGEVGQTTVTYDQLGEMPYTHAVIKELLRLYPPGAALTRVVPEDTVVGGYLLLKGEFVLFDVYNLQRDPTFWENANTFDPERWLNGSKVSHPCAYMPFGLGPRSCVGMSFSVVEMRTFVPLMMRSFQFDRVPNQTMKLHLHGLTVQPDSDFRISLSRV